MIKFVYLYYAGDSHGLPCYHASTSEDKEDEYKPIAKEKGLAWTKAEDATYFTATDQTAYCETCKEHVYEVTGTSSWLDGKYLTEDYDETTDTGKKADTKKAFKSLNGLWTYEVSDPTQGSSTTTYKYYFLITGDTAKNEETKNVKVAIDETTNTWNADLSAIGRQTKSIEDSSDLTVSVTVDTSRGTRTFQSAGNTTSFTPSGCTDTGVDAKHYIYEKNKVVTLSINDVDVKNFKKITKEDGSDYTADDWHTAVTGTAYFFDNTDHYFTTAYGAENYKEEHDDKGNKGSCKVCGYDNSDTGNYWLITATVGGHEIDRYYVPKEGGELDLRSKLYKGTLVDKVYTVKKYTWTGTTSGTTKANIYQVGNDIAVNAN